MLGQKAAKTAILLHFHEKQSKNSHFCKTVLQTSWKSVTFDRNSEYGLELFTMVLCVQNKRSLVNTLWTLRVVVRVAGSYGRGAMGGGWCRGMGGGYGHGVWGVWGMGVWGYRTGTGASTGPYSPIQANTVPIQPFLASFDANTAILASFDANTAKLTVFD